MEAFLDLTAELGLLVILRPGPYICAEWEMVSSILAQRGATWFGRSAMALALLTVVPCQPCPGCCPGAHVLLQCCGIALAVFCLCASPGC